MYRTGHYGVALLFYAPVLAALAALHETTLAALGVAGTLAVTTLPDYDQRVPLVSHRGVTHTLAFALVVGSVLAWVGWVVASEGIPRVALAAFGFLVGTLGVVAHLAADVITPAGIVPLWPVSDRRYSLGLTTADDRLWNGVLLAAGVLATALATAPAQSI